jgi:hypothetical protein
VLGRELDLAPQPETVSLYHDIIASRGPLHSPAAGRDHLVAGRSHNPAGSARQPPVPAQARAPARPPRPFVGRERLVQQLCDQLVGGTHRQARLVLITGEAGIGKTRLLEELAATASLRGAAVLGSGRGAHARQFAWGLCAVALENYAASLPETQRREMAHRYPVLACFIPSLQAQGELPAAVKSAADCHLDLGPAVVRLLTDLGRRQPVLLVLGDLHDADPLSLDQLRYLAHLAIRRPWLLVGTVREEDAGTGSEPGRTIEAMIRERLCLAISLRGLPRQDCDTLVHALLPGACADEELLDQIYTWSRGNPLFVGELVREIRQRSDYLHSGIGGEQSSLAAAGVPARVRVLAATRLATMDETLRRVLGLASVSPAAEISLGELVTSGAALEPPVSEAALFDALDRALQMRVLEERSSGYAFCQPLFRSALYESLSRHRRDQLRTALAAPGRSMTPPQLAATPAG